MALDPHAIVALLVERGSALRAAGVVELSIGEMSVKLAPLAEPVIEAPAADVRDELDVLDDPDTFGTDGVPTFDSDEVAQ